MDLKLEVVVLPVSDVDRAKSFYEGLGFRLDADLARGKDGRLVQLTPPGSECSIHIGKGITTAAPGSAQGMYLVVFDIEAARTELIGRGADMGELFHVGPQGPVPGPAPDRSDYGTFAHFNDPDGNLWVVQEVKKRAPGR